MKKIILIAFVGAVLLALLHGGIWLAYRQPTKPYVVETLFYSADQLLTVPGASRIQGDGGPYRTCKMWSDGRQEWEESGPDDPPHVTKLSENTVHIDRLGESVTVSFDIAEPNDPPQHEVYVRGANDALDCIVLLALENALTGEDHNWGEMCRIVRKRLRIENAIYIDPNEPGAVWIDNTTLPEIALCEAEPLLIVDGEKTVMKVHGWASGSPILDINDVNYLTDASIRKIADSGRIHIEDITKRHWSLRPYWLDPPDTITICSLNTAGGYIEFQEIPDPNYWSGTQWRLTRIDDGVIRKLAESGRVCEVIMHQWEWTTHGDVEDCACAVCGFPIWSRKREEGAQ